MTWQPTPLPDHLTQRGGDPMLLGKELLHIIEQDIINQPRSLQKRIGPSEIGHPCPRRIGYKLLGAPEWNDQINWKAYVGTAMHAQLEKVLDAHNLAHEPQIGEERFYIEQKVSAGEINGETIDGSTDVYDRVTATVVDWKLTGPSMRKGYARNGPGHTYKTQAHAYGRGWTRLGLPVDNVMIVFLPRNEDLRHTVIWHEPYDEQIAIDGFNRASAIDSTCKALGVAALAQLPTADAYCTRCPFYVAGSQNLAAGCPGDPQARTSTPAPALSMTGGPA